MRLNADLRFITKELKKVGYDTGKPPELPNVRQVREFVNAFAKTLKLGSRMSTEG